MSKNSERRPLNKHSRNRQEEFNCCQTTRIVILVLFFCGLTAWGLSAIILFFYPTGTSTDSTTNATETPTVSTSYPVTVSPFTKPLSCEKRIVGFYSERELKDAKKLELSKLTHAIFAYVEMTWEGNLDLKNDRSTEKFLSLKYKSKNMKTDVKVMVSIGGEENSKNFQSIAINKERKENFLNSVISFLNKYKIDGVDLFWKPIVMNRNHLNLLKDLRRKLDEEEGRKYTISITLPIPELGVLMDPDELLKYADFINIFSMDYYEPSPYHSTVLAAPISPLYSGVDERKHFNVASTVKYFVCETKKPSRFNIAIPFFVRLWKSVKDAVEPTNDAFRRVESLSNRIPSMCRKTLKQNGWNISNASWDEESRSSFIYNPESATYFAFESRESIAEKVKFVNEMNLGGFWLWSVDQDDDENSLLNAVSSEEFCKTSSEDVVKYDYCD
ncbi:hypothetical protein GCK72_005191 [Caenorhabditis remanei]|uniref:GH18 domain-containing protein n=1 Tax=Caenorhabditis remanei TaxID=31234 RepID=A0A6A5HDW9_CAERE|nr:hypothetical protein GCK72_005191 [Caenorhabditis remanei]KAF1765239.1 hypothetical protein GCK72_005191 [Caenorhabditis remanei]